MRKKKIARVQRVVQGLLLCGLLLAPAVGQSQEGFGPGPGRSTVPDLRGRWQAAYPAASGCPAYTEVARLYQDGQRLTLIKGVGNGCVLKGFPTAFAVLSTMIAREVTGYPLSPAGAIKACAPIAVQSPTQFLLCNRVYTKLP